MMMTNIGAGLGVLLFTLRQERRKLVNEIVQENSRIVIIDVTSAVPAPNLTAPKKPSSSVESVSGSEYLSWSMISAASPSPKPH